MVNTKKTPKRLEILGVSVGSRNKDDLLNSVRKRLTINSRIVLTTPNPEIILKAQKDKELARIINNSDIAIADGKGILFASRFINEYNKSNNVFKSLTKIFSKSKYDIEIIKGRELFIDLIKLADEKSWRIVLFGGMGDEAEKAMEVLSKEFNNVQFDFYKGCTYDNDGRVIGTTSKKMEEETIKKINSFKPHILFVALGCPKQEKWIDRNLRGLTVGLAMTVGGAFRYVSGNTKLPPKIFSKNLEWLWRLITEPKRIKRIFNALVVFPVKVCLHTINTKGLE